VQSAASLRLEVAIDKSIVRTVQKCESLKSMKDTIKNALNNFK
jgi:hypothetical protein